jgi:four helix bundle protein
VRIIRLYQALDESSVGRVLGKQLLRSGTSIGANVEEAQAGQSKADFIAKMNIALKEARETRYWLTLILEAELFPATRLNPILVETEELIKIIYTIIQKTKNKSKKILTTTD